MAMVEPGAFSRAFSSHVQGHWASAASTLRFTHITAHLNLLLILVLGSMENVTLVNLILCLHF